MVLDISHVPDLVELDCSINQLLMLDLTNVPRLSKLLCAHNFLTELHLGSSVEDFLNEKTGTILPELVQLACNNNQLQNLDVSALRRLTELECYNNKIVELDIRNCDKLEKLTIDTWVKVVMKPDQTVKIVRV